MPEEFSRTTKRKRITLPHGGTVDLPVITKITFIDPFEQYQETEFTIDNNTSERVVRVDQVPSTQDPSGAKLPVERIKKWKWHDPFERHQDAEMEMDNETGADSVPPHFSTHSKTHVKRYSNEVNGTIWIESELIDEFAVIDPFQRYQENNYILANTDAPANVDDPDIAGGDGIDPPWRTDPFQNIIDWSDHTSDTGDDGLARVSTWISGAIVWTDAYVGSPPNRLEYVGHATTFIESGRADSENPATGSFGLYFHGLEFRPAENGPQSGNSSLASETIAVPTAQSVSAAGLVLTLATVSFTNGDTFSGVSFNFAGITATYVSPTTANAPPGYTFPFSGPVRDINFTAETITQNPFYPAPDPAPESRSLHYLILVETTA